MAMPPSLSMAKGLFMSLSFVSMPSMVENTPAQSSKMPHTATNTKTNSMASTTSHTMRFHLSVIVYL